jgi:16S rRNA (guanine527-N7)-methyltransferase
MFHVKHPPEGRLGPADVQAVIGFDDAARRRLETYAALLEKWQKKINLVGKATLDDPWRRHFLDSAQLFPLIPENAATLMDLGSGAGFPGLVLAALRPELTVTLIDSDARKGVFLREAAREMGVPVTVLTGRIEAATPMPADVVTSRALAPLATLLSYAHPFRKAGTTCLFLKGKRVQDELTAAREEWTMSASVTPSLSDPQGAIVRITDFSRRAEAAVRKV